MNTRLTATVCLASALALAACKKQPPEELPPPPQQTAPTTTPAPTGPGVAAPGTQRHFTETVGAQNTVVYFDTDRYNIDAEDTRRLQVQAQYFSQYPQITFTVEGHADERGTREYNLALGARRANAIRDYLGALGVTPNRVNTISYGKERPAVLGSNNEAWAQNRRGVVVVE